MPGPFLIAQLSDPHIGATWAPTDPVAGLRAAVAAVHALGPATVLVTGDLVDHGEDAEYELLREVLAPLDGRLYVLPGNHDNRAAMRRHFTLPGADDEPIQYSAELGPVRLLALDTTHPGEDSGELDGERLAWLGDLLTARNELPALIAMHHPPFLCGLPAMDAVSLGLEDRHATGELIRVHPHVCGSVAGHIHRAAVARVGDRPAVTAPSTYAQVQFDVHAQSLVFTAEPPSFAIHALLDGELVSHFLTA
jgi:Icc protein